MNLNGNIYKITNKINGKVYIGQTIHSIEYRFSKHCLKNKTLQLLNRKLELGSFIVELIVALLVFSCSY